ncbi:MAG: FecR family protein [Myxococcota bacterium]|nr:FecR family protein [Myxococcota bacterium]
MGFRKKVSVKPPTDAGWGRVERAVGQTLEDRGPAATPLPAHLTVHKERRRENEPSLRSPSLVLAGAAAAAIGAFSWRSIAQREQREAQPSLLRVETAEMGSRVRVGESTVDLGPRSSARVIGDDAHGVVVVLDAGRVEVDVSLRRDHPPFVVQAGLVEIRFVATDFVVTRAGPVVGVEVQRGEVDVVSGNQHTRVGPSAHWPASQEPSVTDSPALAPPPDLGPPTVKSSR